MITTTINNFGSGIISFNDYQSKDLCVLNGKFEYDPLNESYLNASRLEITLPSDFLMKRSALSSAILFSSMDKKHCGTLLKCWIENRTICIEKITEWDSYGVVTIYINSLFVTRGYRGKLEPTSYTNVLLPSDITFDRRYCHVSDDVAYLLIAFEKFRISNEDYGPQVIELGNFPKDTFVEFPVPIRDYDISSVDKGTYLAKAYIQGGRFFIEMDETLLDFGDTHVFFIVAIPRGTYSPRESISGQVILSEESVYSKDDSILSTMNFKMGAPSSFISLAALYTNSENSRIVRLGLSDYPRIAPNYIHAQVLSRSSAAEGYRVSQKEIVISEPTCEMTLTTQVDNKYVDEEIFSSVISCTNLKAHNISY